MADDGALPDLGALRARLVSLARAHADGTLDEEAYATRRREAERALGDALLASTPPPATVRPSGRLVASLAIAVVVVAVAGYAWRGAPSLAGLGTPPPPAPVAADASREAGIRQIAAMVDSLAARLRERPDDAEGWTMLGRSYMVLERFPEAVAAYRHAESLEPRNAVLLADLADALAAAGDGHPTAESEALLARALAIDPKQPKALALAGTVAFDRGDYGTAVAQWQKIADALPPDGEFHRQVMANIDEARRRGGLSATASTKTGPATAREAIGGTVTLGEGLASQASPDDTVFVYAHPVGARMPLAVVRAKAADLPLHFRLDDTMAMTPTMKLSGQKQVVVTARISKSGNALTQPGDLVGDSGPVTPGTANVAITIDGRAP